MTGGRSSQKGFTLVEVLVAMTIGVVILTGVVGAIIQSTRLTRQHSAVLTALENIKAAGYRVVQDVKQANTTNLVDGSPAVNNLTLDWTIWYDTSGNFLTYGEYHRCKYYLVGTELRRQHGTYRPSATPTLPIPDGSFTWEADRAVARSIASAGFSRQGTIIKATINSSPEGRAETAEERTFYIYLQPKASLVQ